MSNSRALKRLFEERLKRQGIPVPKDLVEEGITPAAGIVQDEHGRYWKYNESHTMKWRVDKYGNDLTLKNRFDKLRAEDAKWKSLINNEKDAEVRALLEEEEMYDGVGGSAQQWAQLDKKKEDIRKRGKLLPMTPVDLRRRIAEVGKV